MRHRAGVVVVTLGSQDRADEWRAMPEVRRVVTHTRATPSGYRFGNRALGLGLDAFVVAAMAAIRGRNATYLVTNPWIAVWLRVLTWRPIIVTGLYAWPGTPHWRLFRTLLRTSPVITHSSIEARNWAEAGGASTFVRYGNTFPYSACNRDPDTLTIFVGGSSDRDLTALAELEDEVLACGGSVRLLVAVGGDPSRRQRESAVVEHFGHVTQEEFGQLMAAADITYLPLENTPRAAGHMILVGSLQVGTPVLLAGGLGMDGYVDDVFVRRADPTRSPLVEVQTHASAAPSAAEVTAYWQNNFSRRRYIERVRGAALAMMCPREDL